MTMDPRTVGPRIRMRMPEMTPSEARVAEVILRHAGGEPLPIKQVADEAETSAALVVKTAKKLGFAGFKEMRAAIQAYRGQPNADLHEDVQPHDTAEVIVQKVFRTAVQALEETMAILDMDAFRRAVDVVHAAGQRDFYGLGGSAHIARDVAHKFLRIGVRASVHDDTHMMAMSASLLGPRDVVIAFSHSGRTTGVLDAVQIARGNGATVIAVTNYGNSPLAAACDVVLCSTALGSPLSSENAAARIAQLNIMDAVFIALAQKDLDRAEHQLARTMQAVRTKRRP